MDIVNMHYFANKTNSMGNRLNKITTYQGDKGNTGLADGERLDKDDPRIHCLGEVDELNAVIGVSNSQITDESLHQILLRIQHDLFDLGAELSMPGSSLITSRHVDALDRSIEELNADLPPLKEFILPAGSQAVTLLHLARTVCRRVERSLVALHHHEAQNGKSLQYLNRLSDLLFIVSRYQSRITDNPEIYWQSEFSRVQQ